MKMLNNEQIEQHIRNASGPAADLAKMSVSELIHILTEKGIDVETYLHHTGSGSYRKEPETTSPETRLPEETDFRMARAKRADREAGVLKKNKPDVVNHPATIYNYYNCVFNTYNEACRGAFGQYGFCGVSSIFWRELR